MHALLQTEMESRELSLNLLILNCLQFKIIHMQHWHVLWQHNLMTFAASFPQPSLVHLSQDVPSSFPEVLLDMIPHYLFLETVPFLAMGKSNWLPQNHFLLFERRTISTPLTFRSLFVRFRFLSICPTQMKTPIQISASFC